MTDANKAAQMPHELELYNAVNLVRDGFVLRERIFDDEAQHYLSAIEYVIQTALTRPATNTGELRYAIGVIEAEVMKEANSYLKNRPEATPGFAQVIVDSWKMIKAALAPRQVDVEGLLLVIGETLRQHNLSLIQDDHGNGYPLIDALTYKGKTVQDGIDEIDNILDCLASPIKDHLAQRNLLAAPTQDTKGE